MAIPPNRTEAVGIAVFARAPRAGAAKTRLIPALGAAGAARLQRRLTLRTLATALGAGLGPVTLWVAPDDRHRFFRSLRRRGLPLRCQSGADLGARMAAAFTAEQGPVLLIGTDCPALAPEDLRACADALRSGNDAVFLPAEDGGYVLVGLRRPQPRLFEQVDWSTDQVMAQTRERLRETGLSWSEPRTLWDVDRPEDLQRLQALDSGLYRCSAAG